ncbi:MAG: HEAT repeat domain-containing protein [Myxococcales bacterium]|nr:HEAT repeat domain-containing protein [Myxococcales bacterium]
MTRAWLCLLLFACASTAGAQRRAWSEHLPALEAARALQSSESRARREAAAALATRGDEETARVVLLEAPVSERDASVRRALGEALEARAHASNVEGLGEALRTASPVDATALSSALAAVGTAEAAQALVDALVARDDLRAPIAAALRSMGIIATPALTARLRDEPTFLPAIELLAGDVEATPMLARLADGAGTGFPPPVRRAALVALARAGDARARPAVLRATEDPDENVAALAWDALARVGRPGDVGLLAARLEGAEGALRTKLLRQVMALDVGVAEPLLRAEVTSDDPDRVRAAADLVLSSPHAALLPILHGLIREGSRAEEAADALVEVDAGAGLGVLASELEHGAADTHEAVTLAIALTMRRWPLPRVERVRGLEALRGLSGERGLWLRAVAQDPTVAPAWRDRLGDVAPDRRALAAYALALLDDRDARPALVDALEAETDVDVWRTAAVALAMLGGTLEPAPLLAALADEARAPEAALLVSGAPMSARHASRRDRQLRRLLRSTDPRARAHAALALGRLGQGGAWRAILDVATDPTPTVRRAAASALATLPLSPSARGAVARHARRTTELPLRRLFERAASGLPYAAPRGREVLRARVVSSSVAGLRAEIALGDGRTLRLPVPESGELVLADLPSQVADVQIRAGAR